MLINNWKFSRFLLRGLNTIYNGVNMAKKIIRANCFQALRDEDLLELYQK